MIYANAGPAILRLLISYDDIFIVGIMCAILHCLINFYSMSRNYLNDVESHIQMELSFVEVIASPTIDECPCSEPTSHLPNCA